MYKFWPPHLELLGGNSQQFRAVARFDLNLLGSRRHSSSRPGGLWGRAAFRRFLIQNPEFKTQLQDAWIADRTGLVKFALDLVNDAQPTGLNLWRCVGVGSPTWLAGKAQGKDPRQSAPVRSIKEKSMWT